MLYQRMPAGMRRRAKAIPECGQGYNPSVNVGLVTIAIICVVAAVVGGNLTFLGSNAFSGTVREFLGA
jgi:hypothetical protein